MSRIDEALRRAVPEHRSRVGTVAGTESGSPWQFDESTGEARPASESPSADLGARAALPPAPSGPALAMPVGEPGGVFEGLSSKWAGRLTVSPNAEWLLVEQFRRLAATLHQAQLDANMRTVMITSALPGDGKTLTAINLALTLSESYRRKVLLIDADLRRPSIRDISDQPNVFGLSEGLRAKSDQPLTVLPITRNLTLLPAGRPDPDPMGGLTSSRMRRILDDAVHRFDWVILDSPPVGGIADTSLLVGMVDTALLVVRSGQTQCATVQHAINALGRERILGVVLNGATASDQPSYTYSYEYSPEANKGRLRG